MKLITENYLLFNNLKEFNNLTLMYFYERLCMFLSITPNDLPKVIFTKSKQTIEKYLGERMENTLRAFYDEDTNIIVFNAESYDTNSKYFFYNYENISYEIGEETLNGYKYVIPLSDIYHELIHVVQFQNTKYYYTNILEGSDELFTYFITGQSNIDYIKDAIGIWYIARKILKLKKSHLYLFVRDVITGEKWTSKYLMSNKDFIRILAEEYNADLDKFLYHIDKLYNKKYVDKFYKDINYIHNLIFYKY